MENKITFTRYWYLIKSTTNSARIRANWINCVLYKVLLSLHLFPLLNIYCTKPYLGPVQRSYVYLYWQSHGPLIPIKIIVQFFECRIPERVLLNGAISICRRFSKVSHRFEAKMCGLSLLAIFTFWVFTLWHITLVLYSKRKSSITAPAPLTTKLISKQASLNATKSILVFLIFLSGNLSGNSRFPLSRLKSSRLVSWKMIPHIWQYLPGLSTWIPVS